MKRYTNQFLHLQRILDFPVYQEFKTASWKAKAGKETSHCNVRCLLARRVSVYHKQKLDKGESNVQYSSQAADKEIEV